ncbi:MAG: uracil-DNA glycosylase family protein, partial [Spirochaetaceae bacterium]|nr:uracil-DNA glycosylase family protein [Spirochaetaceae bacterium]
MMDKAAYGAFCKCRDNFRAITDDIQNALPDLQKLQQTLVDSREGPRYSVDTPVVYNNALDDVGEDSDIRLIFVGDNPGRREQDAANRRYLVGPSGKIAENFFKNTPGLGIDFRKNVIILNKTPVHTPRTVCLKELRGMGGEKLCAAIDESQTKMAELLAGFFDALRVPVWISGYSEMKPKGVFERYTSALQDLLRRGALDRDSVFLYRHFS